MSINLNKFLAAAGIASRRGADELIKTGKVKGFSIDDMDKKFDINFLKRYRVELKDLLKNETIEIKNRRVRLTEYGFDVSNQVFLKFR